MFYNALIEHNLISSITHSIFISGGDNNYYLTTNLNSAFDRFFEENNGKYLLINYDFNDSDKDLLDCLRAK